MNLPYNGNNIRSAKTIKIGDTYLPPLKNFSVQLYDLQSEGYRDLTSDALLHKETLCRDKVKLVCEWGYLSSDEAAVILNAASTDEFTKCEFYNPYKQSFDTIMVYRGDRNATIYRNIVNEDGSISVDYSSLTVNFIER